MTPRLLPHAKRLALSVVLLILPWGADGAPRLVPLGATPWGRPVDGLRCRLVLQPAYAIGQAVTVAIEVQNVSDRKRFFVPWLDPLQVEYLTVTVTGPRGENVPQGRMAKGYTLYENSFQPIEPGAVRRFEVADLRDYFRGLEPWWSYPSRQANAVAPGRYTVRFRFRSLAVPEHFKTAQRVVAGKTEFVTGRPSAELVAGQWAGEIASAPVAFEIEPLGKEDLVVHEWGVFTVFNDVRYANADRAAEWGGLPSYFYRQFPTQRLRWVPAAWDKPVVHIYAKPRPLRLNVKVTFAEGAPVVWWPAAADPVDDGGFGVRPLKPGRGPRPFRSLTWEAWLGERVPGPAGKDWEKAKEFALPDGCWLRQARLPDACPLTVVGNIEGPPTRRFPGALDRPETERFLYYDGLVPAPDYLRCAKIEADAVVLRNRAGFDLARLFVVDRRNKGAVRFARVDTLKAGTSLRVEPRPAADWPGEGVKQVRQALLDAGLFAAEADALLAIWRQKFLEAEGITAFHILPAAEYDRMLPLDVLPAPAAKPVRVGVALHSRLEIEPDRAARVAALIRQLGEEKFERRAAASAELLEIGPLAVSLLREVLAHDPPLEVRRRIEMVLERVDASAWLNAPAAGKK